MTRVGVQAMAQQQADLDESVTRLSSLLKEPEQQDADLDAAVTRLSSLLEEKATSQTSAEVCTLRRPRPFSLSSTSLFVSLRSTAECMNDH